MAARVECSCCAATLARARNVASKAFAGRLGRAFLVSIVQNTSVGPAEDRMLLTGRHTVADLLCKSCNSLVGWKYIKAYDKSQKYKEGAFVLEKAKTAKDNAWAVTDG